MRPSKVDDTDYIDYLISAQKAFTCTEASRSQPLRPNPFEMPALDSFNRMLERSFLQGSRDSLWREAMAFVNLKDGNLVVDDTTLDKPYAKKMELVIFVTDELSSILKRMAPG